MKFASNFLENYSCIFTLHVLDMCILAPTAPAPNSQNNLKISFVYLIEGELKFQQTFQKYLVRGQNNDSYFPQLQNLTLWGFK